MYQSTFERLQGVLARYLPRQDLTFGQILGILARIQELVSHKRDDQTVPEGEQRALDAMLNIAATALGSSEWEDREVDDDSDYSDYREDLRELQQLLFQLMDSTTATPEESDRQLRELVREFEKGNLAEARKMHYKLFPLIKAMFIETNPAPVKQSMELMGIISGEIRLPLCRMKPENIEKLKKVLRDYGLV